MSHQVETGVGQDGDRNSAAYSSRFSEQIDNKEEKEIGYRLDLNFGGQGLATEAAAAAIQYGFEQFKFRIFLALLNLKIRHP